MFLKEDIQRQEAERLRLAHRLHDEVLGQLAVLGQNHGDSKAGDRFQENYEATVRQIREVIAGLRPAALNFGLEPAINDLVDRITETNRSSSILELNLQVDQPESPRYPVEVELQVYRIIQQACQNALQHASAAHIWINGILNPDAIEMTVIDDGKGFDSSPVVDFEELLKRKHYGLVSMAERAALIDANLVIASFPAAGTEVRLHWQASPMD